MLPFKRILLTFTLAALTASAEDCPKFQPAESLPSPALAGLREISGIVASRRYEGVFWVHNDSGDTARIYALGADGAHLGTFNLAGASARDYEDIALGPGPESGADYLYVGDIGDNDQERPAITVYRVAEPVVDKDAAPADAALTGVEAFELRYPGAPESVYNAETLLVDPADGTVLIVTKDLGAEAGLSHVFAAPNPLNPAGPNTLTEVATLNFGPGRAHQITGGDIRGDGREVALRTYSLIYLWPRLAGAGWAEVFGQAPCKVIPGIEPQGEAVCFAADGINLYTVSEAAKKKPAAPFHRYARKPAP
ncbi:MAG: hypothetical protein GC168_13505 [Candidatus Hydrogenedens sp.]|nr:hypothetical protein [Candidatus Hydrogenedens sp.]